MNAQRPRLLIAQDDEHLRQFFRRFLGEQGYDVDTAAGLEECLLKLREHHPAALLLDTELPGAGCNVVLNNMREDLAGVQTPVVLVSEMRVSESGLEAPVVACLQKPFHLEEVLEALRQASVPTISMDAFGQLIGDES